MLSCLIKKNQAYMRHSLGMNFRTTGWGVGLRNKKTNKTWIWHTEEDGDNNFAVPQFGMV